MFYVKENINDTVEVKVELNDENVFCTCPTAVRKYPLTCLLYLQTAWAICMARQFAVLPARRKEWRH